MFISLIKNTSFVQQCFLKILIIATILVITILTAYTDDFSLFEKENNDIYEIDFSTPSEVMRSSNITQNKVNSNFYKNLSSWTKIIPGDDKKNILLSMSKYLDHAISKQSVDYNRQAAYDYANYYWDEVCNDGYYMAIDVYKNTYAVSFPLGTYYLDIHSYFKNHNPELYGADCAHFVSCCIGNNGGGGLPVLHDYAPNVYGYVGANNLANWILNNYGVVKYSIEELEMGDVILYDSVAGQHIVLYLGDGLIAAHSSCLWGKTNIPFYGKSWIQPDLEVNKLIHINSTIELAPPPELIYPTDNSNIYTTTPTFEWNSVSTADGYGLYIRDIASGEMVYETGEQPLYGTSLELPGGILEDGRSYWWNMNSYNSAGWNPDCSIHWKFTVQIDNYPTVNSFIVNPISITLGDSFDISYSVSDDVGLSWVELWRTNDKNGQPDENGWTQIGPQYPISGKSYSGEFHDSPSLSGIYWYGIHVGDTAGNWSVEPKPPGPIMVTVNNPTVNPPTGVQATDGTYTDKVRITWNSVSGASYYHVYRATSSGGSKTPLGSWQSSTTYDDTSAIPGQAYYYFIKAATSSSGSNASDYSVYNEGYCSITRIIHLEGDLNFGNVQEGSTSQKTLTIYNDGNSALTVSSINFPTGFSGNWNGTIFAGGSHNVTITFSPTQPIIYSGNLTVNSDATSGTNTKSVSGTGVPSTYSPQVTTNDASNITSVSAQLNGNLDSIGNLICQVWFEYGKTTSYGISTTQQSKSSTGLFNDTINSLDPNTTYHFKACASNSKGTVYAADKTFITPMLGDFGSANNGSPDCIVDFEDLMIFAIAYGSTPSDPNWNPVCDIASPGGVLIPDGVIDFEDLMVFAMHYGETCAD